jgi:hypothetical protein
MLRDMTRVSRFEDLNDTELNVLLAAYDITTRHRKVFSSEQVRQHELVADTPQATYYRALRSLQAKQLLAKASGYRAGKYHIHSNLVRRTTKAVSN